MLLGFVLAHVHKHAPLVPHPCALHFTKLPAYLFSFVNYSIIYALQMQSIYDIKLATKTRLELVTSSVTGWHSNQLNYLAISGGRYRARTYDPLLVRQMLSQLSYTPINIVGAGEGDRTLTAGLEGQNSTIELHPHIKK